MIKKIILLTDYKEHFGSKQKSKFYQSGMDVFLLCNLFTKNGFDATIKNFSEINFRTDAMEGVYFLYTSSEDPNHLYKSFVEDILLGISISGGILIPEFRLFRAHDNKVFMEILRDTVLPKNAKSITTHYFGTKEDFYKKSFKLTFPAVIKKPAGAMSKGVFLANDFKSALNIVKKISRSRDVFAEFKELVRSKKYKGYKRISSFRKKFIVQNFISSLSNDWKILIFGKKYYILKRMNRNNDFRASGGGKLEYTTDYPSGMLDFAETIYSSLNTPFISLDVAFDGKYFHLFEFQCIYFGTTTLEFSTCYYSKKGDKWQQYKKESSLEIEYANAVIEYIT